MLMLIVRKGCDGWVVDRQQSVSRLVCVYVRVYAFAQWVCMCAFVSSRSALCVVVSAGIAVAYVHFSSSSVKV